MLGFFHEPDVDWYENVHAPDFLSFAAPYMARHARNWIKEVEQGEAPINVHVITELQFISHAAKDQVRSLLYTPAGEPLLRRTREHNAAQKKVAGDSSDSATTPLFSVTPHPVKNISRSAEVNIGSSIIQRRMVLLRRPDKVSQENFEAAVFDFAHSIMEKDSRIDISFDVFESRPEERPADAVIYIANSDSAVSLVPEQDRLHVLCVLRVETRSSKVGDEAPQER